MTSMSNEISGSTVVILTSDGVDADAIVAMRLALKEAGVTIVVAAAHSTVINSSQGFPVIVDYTLSVNESFEFDAIFVPDGLGIDMLCTDIRALEFFQDAYKSGKVLACSGNGREFIEKVALLIDPAESILMLERVINDSNMNSDFFQQIISAISYRRDMRLN